MVDDADAPAVDAATVRFPGDGGRDPTVDSFEVLPFQRSHPDFSPPAGVRELGHVRINPRQPPFYGVDAAFTLITFPNVLGSPVCYDGPITS